MSATTTDKPVDPIEERYLEIKRLLAEIHRILDEMLEGRRKP